MKKYLNELKIDKRASYSVIDVIRTIRLLSEESLGRITLMKKLGASEASVKTLIKRLSKDGVIKPSTKGQILTKKGRRIAKAFNKKISKSVKVQIPKISSKPTIALVVKNAASNVKIGIEQRDEAIKLDVNVTTLVYVGDELKLPCMEECKVAEINKIRDEFELKNNDVIIVASGSDHINAEKGAIAAALTLI